MNVNIIGSATTKFGELWGISPRILAGQAVSSALIDAGIDRNQIEAIFVGNMLSGLLGRQEHLGAFFAEELGLNHAAAFKIEGACASGGLAVHSGVNSILSGQYKSVVILGIEKMTDYKPEEVASALMGAGTDEERTSGATFPALYAILANSHMQKFGTTSANLAAVAVKNHYHGKLNPNAQFRNLISVDQVLSSSCIADPLRLLDCSPISDGAAAIVIKGQGSRAKGQKGGKSVEIIASTVATDSLGLSGRESLTELKSTQMAAYKAYKISGLSARDIDVAEVHDCFTIAEILAMEDLGFYQKGEAAGHLANFETQLGNIGKLTVNTSGGLKACGHPVGATGVKQICELYDQLSGRAGDRQIKKARIGLAHNVGGSGATAVVNILKSNK